MKVYSVICSRGGLVAPDFQLFRRKSDALKEACRIIREAREPGFVLRFCGEWVDVFSDNESARKGALSHARNWVRS